MQWPKEEGQTIQWPTEEGQTIQWPKEEGQTIQWPKEEGPDNTMAKKKDKRTNNDQQNATQNTKDRATQTPLKTVEEPRCLGSVSSSYSNLIILVVTT
jgi:hypothetical protein